MTNQQWGQPSLAAIRNCWFVRITVIKENHAPWNNPLVVRKGAGYHSCQMPLGLGPLTCFLTSEEDELLEYQIWLKKKIKIFWKICQFSIIFKQNYNGFKLRPCASSCLSCGYEQYQLEYIINILFNYICFHIFLNKISRKLNILSYKWDGNYFYYFIQKIFN